MTAIFCRRRALNDVACRRGRRRHRAAFSAVEYAPLGRILGRRGRVRISWSNSWGGARVVSPAYASPMGVELSIYSIEERLAIANKKNPSSIPSWLGLRASNTITFCSKYPSKTRGTSRCDSRGIFFCTKIHGVPTRKKKIHLDGISEFSYVSNFHKKGRKVTYRGSACTSLVSLLGRPKCFNFF